MQINSPVDLKKFQIKDLPQICNELRHETISIVAKTGGHLGAGLGVVELTVALHYVFDTPRDILVWDIGHQAYPHKILTGRREKMNLLRQKDGISGFTKRSESIYDSFIGGHGGTAISSSLGMAVARDLNNEDHEVIAVIGDGSMSAGIAYEAMNNAGSLNSRLIVILNDNKMSIAPAVGALNKYLTKLISSNSYLNLRNKSKKLLKYLPQEISNLAKKLEHNAKNFIANCNFFEEMGFYYVGPIDGHNVTELVDILSNLKADATIKKPILLHVITEKGKGFSDTPCDEKYHAVGKFDIDGNIAKTKSNLPSYTDVFADYLINLAENDQKIVAITAAMPSGTGLNKFAKRFPNRMFDVAMAEQHAVTFAAGLACNEIKPFLAIYSTFMQRAYDQIINDVAIQSLPVRFIIDRAGLVGQDGETHNGSFDITYFSTLPNFIVMCPSDEVELCQMMLTSYYIDNQPVMIRFPRGPATGKVIPNTIEILKIGQGNIIQQGSKILILSLGTRLTAVIEAAALFRQKHGFDPTIVDMRYAKPIDQEIILKLLTNHSVIITIEEGACGGFASQVNNFLNTLKIDLRILNLFYPDYFFEQDTQEEMNKSIQFDSLGILSRIENFIK